MYICIYMYAQDCRHGQGAIGTIYIYIYMYIYVYKCTRRTVATAKGQLAQ